MPIKTFLTSEEIYRIINWPDNLRDRVILHFYSDTGCRVSELLKVRRKDIDIEAGTALIPHLKRGIKKKCPKCGRAGGRNTKFCSKCGYDMSKVLAEGIEERSRLIGLGEETVKLMEEYTKDMNPEDVIVPLTRQAIYNLVRRAAKGIGLGDRVIRNTESGKNHFVHPHSFRSSLAVAWLEYAGDDASKQKALQEQLGHMRFDTTQRYNKLSPSKVASIGKEVRESRFGKSEHE